MKVKVDVKGDANCSSDSYISAGNRDSSQSVIAISSSHQSYNNVSLIPSTSGKISARSPNGNYNEFEDIKRQLHD